MLKRTKQAITSENRQIFLIEDLVRQAFRIGQLQKSLNYGVPEDDKKKLKLRLKELCNELFIDFDKLDENLI